MLLRGYVKGQKLALSSIHNNQLRAKHRALLGLSDNANNFLKQKISEAVEVNLRKIEGIKNIIAR